MEEEKKILIVGIGGVGGYLTGMIGRKYKNITLIARGQRKESLKKHGVVLHSDYNGEIVVKVAAVEESAARIHEIQDFIFLCVKTYSLEEVCETLKSCIDQHTVIVPVMNGADTAERARNYLGKGMVVPSVIYTTSSVNTDFSITQLGQYTRIQLGTENRKEQEAVRRTEEILKTAGIDCEVCTDIRQAVWEKYIFNCAYNVITAYYLGNVEDIRKEKKRREEFRILLEEAVSVAKAEGISIREYYVEEEYERFLSLNEGSTSSLKRDVEAGKLSEFETFGGYLTKAAEKKGAYVPLSKQFYIGLKEKIRSQTESNLKIGK